MKVEIIHSGTKFQILMIAQTDADHAALAQLDAKEVRLIPFLHSGSGEGNSSNGKVVTSLSLTAEKV